MATTPVTGTATRLHGLDTLRAGALGLGIVLHSLMPFVPGLPWLVSDTRSTGLAVAGMYWIHLFRMVLFMALAGYFGRLVLHRRGARAYLSDRLLRVGLPAVALWPLAALPLPVLAQVNLMLRGLEPPAAPGPPADVDLLHVFTPAHLWFLWVLLECALLVVVLRAGAVRLLGADRCGRISRRLGTVLSGRAGAVLAALPYLACLLLQGRVEAGVEEPTTVVPSLTALTAYSGAFVVGWCLQASAGSLARLTRHWRGHLVAGLLLAPAGFLLPAGQTPLLLHGTVLALAGWTWAFALTGLCMRFLDRESRTVRYLADASYWSYLLHLPVLVAVGIALADLAWPIPLKLAVTWAVTAAVLLLSYDLLVRSTWLGSWLHGRRRPRALSRRSRSTGR